GGMSRGWVRRPGARLPARRTRRGAADRPSRSGGSNALHEPADAPEGLFQVLVARRVAGTHMARAGRPEGAARHDRDALLAKQALGELVVGEARARDAR